VPQLQGAHQGSVSEGPQKKQSGISNKKTVLKKTNPQKNKSTKK